MWRSGACPRVTDARIMPGIVFLPYPNLKFVVAALLESASGAPPGGWESVGGFATGAGPDLEFQNISIAGAFAF